MLNKQAVKYQLIFYLREGGFLPFPPPTGKEPFRFVFLFHLTNILISNKYRLKVDTFLSRRNKAPQNFKAINSFKKNRRATE